MNYSDLVSLSNKQIKEMVKRLSTDRDSQDYEDLIEGMMSKNSTDKNKEMPNIEAIAMYLINKKKCKVFDPIFVSNFLGDGKDRPRRKNKGLADLKYFVNNLINGKWTITETQLETLGQIIDKKVTTGEREYLTQEEFDLLFDFGLKNFSFFGLSGVTIHPYTGYSTITFGDLFDCTFAGSVSSVVIEGECRATFTETCDSMSFNDICISIFKGHVCGATFNKPCNSIFSKGAICCKFRDTCQSTFNEDCNSSEFRGDCNATFEGKSNTKLHFFGRINIDGIDHGALIDSYCYVGERSHLLSLGTITDEKVKTITGGEARGINITEKKIDMYVLPPQKEKKNKHVLPPKKKKTK